MPTSGRLCAAAVPIATSATREASAFRKEKQGTKETPETPAPTSFRGATPAPSLRAAPAPERELRLGQGARLSSGGFVP